MKSVGDHVDLYRLECSGRILCANGGIIGLSPSGNEVFEGYDGLLASDGTDWWCEIENCNDDCYTCEKNTNKLTPEEYLEIAEFMLQQWTDFANKQIIKMEEENKKRRVK